jgi:hypothetical protein
MEIVTRLLSVEEYRAGMAEAIKFYASSGIDEILVAYGWSCDCPKEELYIDKRMPIGELDGFIARAEANGYYHVSRDNLHVKDQTGKSEFLFCHEADIHFKTEDEELSQRLNAVWIAKGFATNSTLDEKSC